MNLNIAQPRSLKTKVTLFTLAVFVISIWALAFYASRMLREDMQHLLSDQQFSAASFMAAEVNDELGNRLRALEAVAQGIDPAMMGDAAALQVFLQEVPILQSLFNGGTTILGMDGTVIVDVPISTGRIGANYMYVDNVATAIKEGKSAVGRPIMGPKMQAPVFGMAVPIRDAQGKVIGTLNGMTNLATPNFLDKIAGNTYGKTGGYLLIAPQYRLVVTATDRKRIMEALPAPGVNPSIDRLLQGYEGSLVHVNALGLEQLTSAKQIPVSGWRIAAVLPTAEAFAPIHDMQRRMLLAALLLTLLAGGLTWWMLGRQLSPMLVAARALAGQSDTDQPPSPLPVTSHDEIGQLIDGFNRLLRTIAERENALRESEERHRTILQTALDGFWVLDTRGRVLEANDTYARMSGYSVQELLSLHVHDLEAAETAQDTAARIHHIIAQGQARFESRHRRKDGTVFDVAISAQYRSAEGGRLVAFVQDITDRKQVEDAMRAAQQAAEAANQIKDQFLAKLSHELRTPLTPVLLATSRWQAQTDTPAAFRDDLAMVCRNLELEARLLDDLLDVNRILYGKLSLRREVVSVHQAAREALATVQRVVQKKQLQLSLQLQADHDRVEADPARLQQILWNLLSNATKFTPDTGSITLSTANDPTDHIRIQVTDSGIGIEPELLSKLFHPFEQGGQRVSHQYGGLGLGLTICKSLVEAHEGSITVTSEGKGKGVTLTVRLPLTQAPVAAKPALPPVPATRTTDGVTRILLVEDHADTARMLCRLLRANGYAVQTAGDIASALDRVKHSDFDLLLSDLGLPDGSGHDLMRQLVASGQSLRSIALSGYGTEDDLRRSKEAGFAEHLTKPTSPTQLLAAIERIVGHRPAPQNQRSDHS